MNSNTYKLDITPGGIPLVIHISQYDVGLRQYTFQPFTSVGEFAYVPGATVTLEATKPDGYAVIHNCTYSSDGIITYTLQEQLAAKAGKVWSKVVIRDGVDILGTGAIIWVVDYAGVRDDAIVSDSDVSGIRGLVEAEVRNALAATLPVDKASGAIAHFIDGADDIPVKDLKIGIVPKQSGSGDPSPSNVRPITGWMGANVDRTGVNLWKYMNSRTSAGVTFTYNQTTGAMSVSGTATSNAYNDGSASLSAAEDYTLLKPGAYTFKLFGTLGSNSSPRIYRQLVSLDGTVESASVKTRIDTFTISEPKYAYIRMQVPSGITVDTTVYPMLYAGNYDAIEFEPYRIYTYPISWEAEAGTIYGGTLDVTTGVLTVDKAYYDVPSTDWVNLSTAGVYRHAAPTPAPLSTLGTDPTGIYSNETNVTKYSYGTMKDNYPAISIDSSGRIYIAISNDIGSTDAAMAWLAQHPLSIVYPVASPQTYQLTPTEVRTLLGINNIWADTGDTEVAYRADTAQYIEKRISATQSIIAGIEAEYKASRAYSANQFMIVNNQLYKATTSIASGATITPGTNVTATTASEILTQLLNA